MSKNAVNRVVWCGLLLAYLLIRFFFTQWLDSLGPYASYLFELGLVVTVVLLTGPRFFRFLRFDKRMVAVLAPLFAALGFGVYRLAGVLGHPIPFELKSAETLFFLILVAPILEELIFRFFAWRPLAEIDERLALAVTTILFSYSHYHAIWFVAPEIHGFIQYQTIYTLLLSLGCGLSLWRFQSLTGAILIHFMFNLGFYLGSL